MTEQTNLLPESVRKQRFAASGAKCWGLAWCAAALGTVCFCFLDRQNLEELQRSAARFAAEAAPLKEIQTAQQAMEKEVASIQQRESWLTDSDSSQTLTLMGIISDAAGSNQGRINVQNLRLTSIERPIPVTKENATKKKARGKEKVEFEQRMELNLNGYAVDDLAVASFVSVLREAGVFESVELRSSDSQIFHDHETRLYEVSCVY